MTAKKSTRKPPPKTAPSKPKVAPAHSAKRAERVAWVCLLGLIVLTPLVVGSASGVLASTPPFLKSFFALPKLAVLLVLTFAGTTAWLATLRSGKSVVRFHPVLLVFAGLFVWTAAATATSVHVPTSIVGTYGRAEGLITLAAYSLATFLAVQMVRDATRVVAIARAFVAGSALVVGQGLLQYAGVYGAQFQRGAVITPFSTIGNPDFLGGFLVMAMAVALGLALTEKNTSWRAASWAAFLATAVLWTVIAVRAAWLGGAVAIAVVLAAAVRRRVKLSSVDLGFIAATIAAIGLFVVRAAIGPRTATNVLVRLGNLFDVTETNAATRLELWQGAMRLVAERPVLGWGPGTVRYAFPHTESSELARMIGYERIADSVHNFLLDTAVGAGLPAALALGAIVVWVLTATARRALSREGSSGILLYAAIWGACAGYVVDLMFSISIPSVTTPFWILMGVLIAPIAAERTPKLSPLVWRGAVVFASAVSLAAAVWMATWMTADAAFLAQDSDDVTVRIASLERAVRLAPYETEYRNVLMRESVRRFVAATEAAQQARSAGDAGAEPALQEAESLFYPAESAMRSAVDFNPMEHTNQPRIVNLYISAGYVFDDPSYTQQALEAARAAIAAAPARADVKVSAALALVRLEDLDEAETLLLEALEADPSYPNTYTLLARVYWQTERPADAIAVLRDGLVQLPGDKSISEALAALESTPAAQ